VSAIDTPPVAPEPDAPSRRRIAPFVVAVLALVMVGLFVLLAGAGEAKDETANTRLLDRPAPEATARTADGATFDLARRKGSWVVVNFFQSTCIPCKQEHPELVAFVEQQQALDPTIAAEFYTVVVDDAQDAVEQFFAEQGGDWPVLYDDDGGFAVAFGVAKVPETWVIDPEGIVRARFISQVTAEGLGTTLQQLREMRGPT
jgi:cytochrome c biogenesis protein CcmG/thiol:disulfide interchange protein DsbE